MILKYILLLTFSSAKDFGQKFSDEALDNRLCVAAVIGYDYIEKQLSTVMEKAVKFYTKPEKYKFKMEKSKRYEQFTKDEKSIEFEIPKKGGKISKDLKLIYPINFTSEFATGTIDFGLQIEIVDNKNLRLKNHTVISNFNCSV